MSETTARELAEAEFDQHRKRETETGGALKLEAARHAALVDNMNRLRALRLARGAKPLSVSEKA
jgi:hypothetical protein